MPRLLIIAHAPLASALKSVAVHAYPDCAPRIEALDVDADASTEAIEARAQALLGATGDPEVLILTDVFGATPANAAQRLAQDPRVRVVAGVNVPMLWRCLCYAQEPLDALTARAIAGASQGVMQVASLRQPNQDLEAAADDPDQCHDRQ